MNHGIEFSITPGHGYETVNFSTNVRNTGMNKGPNKLNQSAPMPSSSGTRLDLNGLDKQTADEIPQSARSTLTGRSWLSDSKWSDDDDEDNSAMQSSFGQFGAIPKTSVSAVVAVPKVSNISANNNYPTDAQKQTNTLASKQLNSSDGKQVCDHVSYHFGLDA